MHAPLEPALRVETRPLNELGAIVGAWRALAARALESNVFYEPEFALAAAPVFGRDVSVLLVWSEAGRLLGLFPSRTDRRRYGAVSALIGWTHPYGPLGVPLVDRDHGSPVIAAWLAHLAHDPNGPKLLLLPMLPEGPFATLLRAALLESHSGSVAFDRHQRALLMPGNERAGYLHHVAPKRRKEMRRQRRRLEDLVPVRHVAATTCDDVAGATKEFLRLEAGGWKGAAGTAAALKPAISKFLEGAVAGLTARGQARADLLLAGERPIAAIITLFSGDAAWCWKIAYDESFARYSPGAQLLLDLTQDLVTKDSPVRTDSCAVPDHPMIDHIWHERLVLADLLVAVKPRSDTAFAFARAAEAGRRKALSLAKAMLHRLRG